MDYPGVAQLYKVIADNSRIVVIDQEIVDELKKGKKVDPIEINKRSVQIWVQKIKQEIFKAFIYEINGFRELYAWREDGYDEQFLGYMKGIIPNLRMNAQGFDLI